MAATDSPTLRPVEGIRVPRHKRGAASYERLLDGAERLLAEKGFEGFTTTELSRYSGLSNGAIYWRVESMDALFVAVHERFIERINAQLTIFTEDEAWEHLDLESSVRLAVTQLASVFDRHTGLLRALVLRTGTDPDAAERGANAVRDTGSRMTGRVAAALGAAGRREPELTAAMIFSTAFGALIARITWPEQQPDPEVPWDRFVSELSELCVAYAAWTTG